MMMSLAYSQINSIILQGVSLWLLKTQLEPGLHTQVALDWSCHNDNFLTGGSKMCHYSIFSMLGQISSKQR